MSAAEQAARFQVIVNRPGQLDLQAAIHSCEAIFEALRWIDDGVLDESQDADKLKNTQSYLILAGLSLCEGIAARF